MKEIATLTGNHKQTRGDRVSEAPPPALTGDEFRKLDAYWRACNYLAAGMIYLRSNPLLREPLNVEHIKQLLNPIRDGAVLPILQLNGYKINNPTVLSRISHDELESLFVGYGWTPYFVEGSDPADMHQQMAVTLENCVLEIRRIQQTGDGWVEVASEQVNPV